MSMEKWKNVTENIAERHTDECAEYLAKHGRPFSEPVDGGAPKAIKLTSDAQPKKRGWIIGVSAAAVALCAVGGALFLSRGDSLLPQDTPTTELSTETGETSETAETVAELTFDTYNSGWEASEFDLNQLSVMQLDPLPEDLDVTELPEFKYVEEYLATLSEDEQDELAAMNYSHLNYSWNYLSYNTWVYEVNYSLATGGKNGYYFSQYYIVKDGSIVDCVKEVYGDSMHDGDGGSTSMLWRDGVLFCHEGGIFMISASTMQAKDIISSDSLCLIDHVTDNYIIYHEQDGTMRVFDWYWGKLTETDLCFYTENSEQYGTQVICTASDDRESFFSYDLATGEKTPLDMTLEECEALRLKYDVQSEDYAANYINDEIPDGTPEYAFNTINNGKFEILYKQSGRRVTVKLDEIRSLFSDSETLTHELIGFNEDVLYFSLNENDDDKRCALAAVDVNTFKAAVMLFEEGGYINSFNAQTGIAMHRNGRYMTSARLTEDLGYIGIEETAEIEYVIGADPVDDTSLWRTHTVHTYPIEEQVGYDVPIDITTLPNYKFALEYADQLDEEQRQQLIEHNYSELALQRIYIGTHDADWLYAAHYYLQEGGFNQSYYARFFYVNDGKVGENILESYGQFNAFYEWGDTIVIGCGDAVYQLARGSTEPKKLFDINGNFCRISRLTDDYILYHDGDLRFKLYYPDSGETYTTDIYMGIHDGPQRGFVGDCLVYCDSIQGTGKHKSFDLITHELVELDMGAAQFKELITTEGVKNERHTAVAANDFKVKFSADGGNEFSYSLRELARATEYDTRSLDVYPLGFDGDVLYIAAKSAHSKLETTLVALNVVTMEGAKYDFEQRYTLTFSEQTGAVTAYDDLDGIHTEIRYVGEAEEEQSPDSVLTIWAPNDQLAYLLKYIPNFTFVNGGYTGYIGTTPVLLKLVPGPNADGDYFLSLQHRLEKEALGEIPQNEWVDIYVIEDYYAEQLVQSTYSLPLKEIGITDEDTAQMYPYTKQLGTDEQGHLKAVAWQANPVAFAYRRSMAREVLGTDDPKEVSKYLNDWESFDNTAELMKQHGYYMLSGCENSFMSVNGGSWHYENGALTIPENIQDWLERAKLYNDNGWSNNSSFWNDDWARDFEADGDVFGIFFPPWGVNATLMYNAGDEGFGDWAVCAGPQTYYEGNTMLCVSPRTDNDVLAAQVIKALTCDYNVMHNIAVSEGDFYHLLNNMAVMENITQTSTIYGVDHGYVYTSDFLGGQNSVTVFDENAKRISIDSNSDLDDRIFDKRMEDQLQYLSSDYIRGEISYEELLDKLSSYAQAISTATE